MTHPPHRRTALLLVVVPGLALAALGARAVVTEADAAQQRARDRARAAATRLARSVSSVVAEFEEALPRAGAPIGIERLGAALDFLEPSWVVDGRGRTLESPAAVAAVVSDRDTALVEDALARANAMGVDDGGALSAAAMLAGVSRIVESPDGVAVLRIMAARLAADAGRPQEALADLGVATEAARRTAADQEHELLVGALALAVENLAQLPQEASVPAWVVDSYLRVAADPWGLEDGVRGELLARVEDVLDERLPPDAIALRTIHDDVRGLARTPSPPRVTVAARGDRLRVRVFRRVEVALPSGTVLALIGGQVPALTVSERLEREARALVRDGGADTVRLLAPDGGAVLERRAAAPQDDGEPLLEAVVLDPPIAGWRVEATVNAPQGPSPLALLLALAGIATTVALVLGAVALDRAARRQGRLAEDRKRFLDHVAHEIRTPAAALLNLTEELEAGHVTGDREALYRKHLATEARRLAELVDDTLDLTRLEAGRLTFLRERVDLRDVVRTAVEASRARTAARGGAGPEVLVSVPDAEVSAAVDRAAIVRTVRNLVDNAVHHGGGEQAVEVGLEPRDARALVVVRDFGRGIAPEHQSLLFDRFYRVPSPTHEVKGVGLGLSLCREVARAHGGELTVASEPGRGATFTLELPLGGGGES